MAKNKVKAATDQRGFTMVYNDFLESNVLNHYEKAVFIAIKRFADNDTLKAFPSLKRLHSMTGISRSKIQEVIASLEEKGVLKVEHRVSKTKGNQSNLYTLYDFKELWNVGSSEEMAAVVDDYKDQCDIERLKSRGYIVTKEKELTSEPTKAHTQALELNQFDIVNTTANHVKSQDDCYTLDGIMQYFDYPILIQRVNKDDADAVMNLLCDILNSTKKTIRVNGEDKPSMVVKGKLMKLWYEDLVYAINQFAGQTDRIKNPKAYMLTILYGAKEQGHLDITNQVQHDMFGIKE